MPRCGAQHSAASRAHLPRDGQGLSHLRGVTRTETPKDPKRPRAGDSARPAAQIAPRTPRRMTVLAGLPSRWPSATCGA
eukprot:9187708-Lingulodinium_polyedra.AAC.1